MAPASKNSSALPLLAGGIMILLVALGALWMLDETPADETDGPGILADADVDAGMDVPDRDPVMDLPEGAVERPVPIPNVVSDVRPPISDDVTGYEDPVVIIGWVEDLEENRIADIEVNLFDDLAEYMDSVLTDERGEFVFTSDVALSAGWSLGTEPELLDPDDPDALAPAYYTHKAAAVPGEAPVRCKLVLGPPPVLSGRVYDAVTRKSIELADVEVVCMSRAWEAEFQDTYTDEGGNFSMRLVDVPLRDLILKVEDDDGRYEIIGPLTLEPGESRFLDIPLSEPLSLRGTVRSALDSSPIDGADITVLPSHPEFEGTDAWDVSDEDGDWEIDDIGVPADRVWLFVEADEHGPALLQVEDLDQPVDIVLGEIVTITGRITDAETGEAVQDAVVRFMLNGPTGLMDDYEDMEFADNDGTFTMVLEMTPPGGSDIIVESDEHVRFRAPLSSLVPTELDMRTYDLSVTLRPLPEF